MDYDYAIVGGRATLKLKGACDYTMDKTKAKALRAIFDKNLHFVVDFSLVSKVDFVFCSFIYGLMEGKDCEIIGTNEQIDEIFTLLRQSLPTANIDFTPPKKSLIESIFVPFGQRVSGFFNTCVDFLAFCGASLWYFFRALKSPSRFKIGRASCRERV